MARRVVIDANIALGLFLKLPYTESVYRLITDLRHAEAELLAPCLLEYEFASGLRRAIALGAISPEDANSILDELIALNIERVPPRVELQRSALLWAERLKQNKLYDAQYVALAELEGDEFWSADQRLVKRLEELGTSWAHWVGEW